MRGIVTRIFSRSRDKASRNSAISAQYIWVSLLFGEVEDVQWSLTVAAEILPAGYELLSEIRHVETIARGSSVRQRRRLNQFFGKGNWRKMKGVALVRFPSGKIHWVEVHWFEAHGIGKKEVKVKSKV